MKRFLILFLITTFSCFNAQTTFFSENMGTPTATTAIASHTFQNSSPITFSGTADVRTSTASSGYAGASGGGNVFFGTSGGNAKEFLISGINTSLYSSITLQIGILATTANNVLTIQVSENGTDFSDLTFVTTATANTWTLKTSTGNIPSTTNLRIKFSKNSGVSFRLDDVKLSGVSSSPLLTALGKIPCTSCAK